MNDLQIFKNAEFGEIRTVIIENEPWFVGKDVAVILGYADPNTAIAMHVDEDDKLNDKSASSLGQRGGWLIKESGLYSLILSSKLASAKRFKKWVTSEVLPSIRKNGGYIAGQEHLSDDELMAKAVLVAQKKIEERENGYLIKSGSSRNMPTQKAADMGLFEVKETTITNPDGSVRVTRTTKVTGKGQQYFINKFLG